MASWFKTFTNFLQNPLGLPTPDDDYDTPSSSVPRAPPPPRAQPKSWYDIISNAISKPFGYNRNPIRQSRPSRPAITESAIREQRETIQRSRSRTGRVIRETKYGMSGLNKTYYEATTPQLAAKIKEYPKFDSKTIRFDNVPIKGQAGRNEIKDRINQVVREHGTAALNDITAKVSYELKKEDDLTVDPITRSKQKRFGLTEGFQDPRRLNKYVDALIDMVQGDISESGENSLNGMTSSGGGSVSITIKGISGGSGDVQVAAELADLIYSPPDGVQCLLGCLAEAGLPTPSPAELMEAIKMKNTKIIPQVKIGAVLKHLDTENKFRINLYKFKAGDTKPYRTNYYPVRCTVLDKTVINILLHENHYMLIRDIKQTARIKPELFVRTTPTIPEETTETRAAYKSSVKLAQKKKAAKPKKEVVDKPIKYKNIYYYDMEALASAINKNENSQDTYAVGLLDVEDLFTINGGALMSRVPKADCMDKVKYWWGNGALDGFLNQLKRIGEARKLDHINHVFAILERTCKVNGEYITLTIQDKRLIVAEMDRILNCDYNNEINPMSLPLPEGVCSKKLSQTVHTTKRNYQATVKGFNNSRYDNFLVLGSSIAQMGLNNVLKSHGLLSVTMFQYIRFEDLIRHTQTEGSLDKVAKSLEVPEEFQKTEFPHDFARPETLNYIGPIPINTFWPRNNFPAHLRSEYNIPCENFDYWKITVDSDLNKVYDVPKEFITKYNISEEDLEFIKHSPDHACEVDHWNNINTKYGIDPEANKGTGDIWDFKKVCIDYLKKDILALAIADVYYCEIMYKITKLDAHDYLTSPSLAYAFAKKMTSKYDIRTVTLQDIDEWIRSCIVGGRTFVQKGEFDSEHAPSIMNLIQTKEWEKMTNDQRREVLSNVQDGLVDFDAVSLYPSAMAKFEYPVGEGVILDDAERNDLMIKLNNGTYDKHAIITCDFIHTTKQVFTPVLSHYDTQNIRRVYDVIDKTDFNATSVDIMEAIKHNKIRITKITKAFEWSEKAPIFKELIELLFNERLRYKKEGNGPMQKLIKLVMNSIYGKYTQKHNLEETVITEYNEVLDTMILKTDNEGLTLLSYEFLSCGERVEMTMSKELDPAKMQPVHIGAFILAYSKVLMNDAIAAIGGFDNPKDSFYYTDTDSMIIRRDQLESLKTKRNRFGDSFVGKKLGQLHDDLGDGESVIISGRWVQPKTYALRWIGYDGDTVVFRTTLRAKGVHCADQYIKYEDFNDMHNGKIIENIPQTTFKRIQKDGVFGVNILNNTKKIGGAWQGRNRDGNEYQPFGYVAN